MMTTMQATCPAWLNVEDLQLNDVDGHFESHGLGLSNGAPMRTGMKVCTLYV